MKGGVALSLCSSSSCVVDRPEHAVRDARLEEIAASVEAPGLSAFTATDHPEEFASKVISHVPHVTIADGVATVTVGDEPARRLHPMVLEHFVVVIFVRNQDGIVVGAEELTAPRFDDELAPVASFVLPRDTVEVTAFQSCNQHGLWKSDPVPAQ
jgi:desulfoferrodoxin (superoxide reductase-like protein)